MVFLPIYVSSQKIQMPKIDFIYTFDTTSISLLQKDGTTKDFNIKLENHIISFNKQKLILDEKQFIVSKIDTTNYCLEITVDKNLKSERVFELYIENGKIYASMSSVKNAKFIFWKNFY